MVALHAAPYNLLLKAARIDGRQVDRRANSGKCSMVFYAANTDFRSKVQFLLAAAAILTVYSVHALLSNVQLAYQITWLSHVTLPSAFALYASFVFVFDRYLWSWPLIRQLHGIPNLNGKWEGTLRRKPFNADEEIRAAHANITQTWSRIEIEYEGATVRSRVTSAAFYLREKASTELLYTYEVLPKTVGKGTASRGEGFQRFTLKESKGHSVLSGLHFSSKFREGYVELTRSAYV